MCACKYKQQCLQLEHNVTTLLNKTIKKGSTAVQYTDIRESKAYPG